MCEHVKKCAWYMFIFVNKNTSKKMTAHRIILGGFLKSVVHATIAKRSVCDTIRNDTQVTLIFAKIRFFFLSMEKLFIIFPFVMRACVYAAGKTFCIDVTGCEGILETHTVYILFYLYKIIDIYV